MIALARFCVAGLAIGLVPVATALYPAQAQSVQQSPDFASICPRMAALENSGSMETMVLPFGEMDLDNDGKNEAVSEVVDGSLGVHKIAVARAGEAAEPTTCYECVDAFTNRVRAVAIDGRRYIVEYSSGYLARLWEMLPDGSTHARCWFQPEHVAQIETALDPPLCEAALNGTVRRVPIAPLPPKQQGPVPAVPELGIYPSNSQRASETIRIDLDSDGTEENVAQFAMFSVGCQSRQAIMILDAAGLPEVSVRNRALSRAQTFSCHTRQYGIIQFGGRFYIEGTGDTRQPTPDAAPALPFWSIIELTPGTTRELCRFRFRSTTAGFAAQ